MQAKARLLISVLFATVIFAENLKVEQDDMLESDLDSTNPGFCELELKNMREAVKSLVSELALLRAALVVESSSKSEISRVWRLIRNQQALIEKEFANVNTQFSGKVRKQSSVETIITQNPRPIILTAENLPYCHTDEASLMKNQCSDCFIKS